MDPFHIIIVGSGVAGLSIARYLPSTVKVTVLSKGALDDGATSLAQGGIAMPVGTSDSVSLHVADTMRAGNNFNNQATVETIIGEAYEALQGLMAIGFTPDTNVDGSLNLGLEGGHSVNRIVHAKDATGRHLHDVLVASVQQKPWIRLLPYVKVEQLIVQNGEVKGVEARNLLTNEVNDVHAYAVVLATGGVGALYEHSTNPPSATADGLVLAEQAGAVINNPDWIQWHPTALVVHKSGVTSDGYVPMPLITEALRGAGAMLVDKEGNDVVPRNLHHLGCLAPRDVVTKACHDRMESTKHHCVYLDARGIDSQALHTEFPGVMVTCARNGYDPRVDLIPVVPAAHYLCGGIVTDINGRTTVPGLYAAGECADVGFHGNNRLASNSLLEGLVMGKRCAMDLIAAIKRTTATAIT